jgi:DNA-binding NtrC family response regulator
MARILIIEDEDQIREMLRQTLTRAGHEVAEARDGEEGLTIFAANPADLVVTDILMPKKGGLVTILELRQQHPELKIIAMSGGGRSGKLNFLSTAKTFPGVRTFRKPFKKTEFLSAVEELLAE